MRHQTCSVSAVLGTAVSLLAALVLAVPRDSDRGARHNAVRTTRGTVQRLDSTESPAHFTEDPEAVVAFAGDGLGDFTVSAPPGGGGSLAIACPAEPPRLTHDSTGTIPVVLPSNLSLRSESSRPVRGRAPPTL